MVDGVWPWLGADIEQDAHTGRQLVQNLGVGPGADLGLRQLPNALHVSAVYVCTR
jgi:hypothetical protein